MEYTKDSKGNLVQVQSWFGRVRNKDGSNIRGTGRNYIQSSRMRSRSMVSDWGYAILGDDQTLEIVKSHKKPEVS